MKKLIPLFLLIILTACSTPKDDSSKAKHQAETGSRLNDAQKDTDGLFKDMEK